MATDLNTYAGGVLPITLDMNGSFSTIFGTTAASAINVNGHNWVANPTTHLYQTGANLAAEWQNYYYIMQVGQGATLNNVQRLEGNAEAVFENTGLAKLSATQLAKDRQDVRREYDALYAAIAGSNLSLNAPFKQSQYLTVENTLQSNASLQELEISPRWILVSQ